MTHAHALARKPTKLTKRTKLTGEAGTDGMCKLRKLRRPQTVNFRRITSRHFPAARALIAAKAAAC